LVRHGHLPEREIMTGIGPVAVRPRVRDRVGRGCERIRRRTHAATRGILTRINPEGLKALRQLALDRTRPVQALMIEASNDLLRKYRRRPAAQTAPRSFDRVWHGYSQ
jgi:hypothetical protein